jgi:hypothetical protein
VPSPASKAASGGGRRALAKTFGKSFIKKPHNREFYQKAAFWRGAKSGSFLIKILFKKLRSL